MAADTITQPDTDLPPFDPAMMSEEGLLAIAPQSAGPVEGDPAPAPVLPRHPLLRLLQARFLRPLSPFLHRLPLRPSLLRLPPPPRQRPRMRR